VKIFGREPAQWIHLISGVLIFLVPFLHLDPVINGAVLAVITAASGLVTAATVSGEQAAPLVAGLLKALFALALALHIALPDQLQAGVMIVVEGIVAWYLRTQVIAPVPPDVPVVVPPTAPPPVVTTTP
jgi:hypothetical protein